jgi:hypothetical protein
MTTLNQMIEVIRAENPDGIRVGSDEAGYTNLNSDEYEAQLKNWAEARLEKLARLENTESAKTTAQAKLAALGLTTDDLKALGL